jgi:hypothetical protein
MTNALFKPVSQRQAHNFFNKLGELGGVGQDADFEAAFSSLAHAYSRDKCPSLEKYEVGFEVLTRSDDGKRAVGITGYQVGNQLFYTPVFWLSGKIKGHELLFLKDQSLFVPLKENWVNYMLERKLPEIGQSVMRDPVRLGIRRPDILRQTRSGLKYAAADLFSDLNGVLAIPAESSGIPQDPTQQPPDSAAAIAMQATQTPPSPAVSPFHIPGMSEAPVAAMPGSGTRLQSAAQSQLPQPDSPTQPDPIMTPDAGDGGDADTLDTFDAQGGGAAGVPTPANMTNAAQNPMATQQPAPAPTPVPAPAQPVPQSGLPPMPGVPQPNQMPGASAGMGQPVGLPKLAILRAMTELPDQDIVSLPDFIRYVGKRAFNEFGRVLEAAPGIAKLAFELHGTKLLAALKFAETYDPPSAVQYQKAAAAMRMSFMVAIPALQIDDSGTVDDKRPAAGNTAVYADKLNVTLSNPACIGVYDVVLRYGRIQKCLVTLNTRKEYGGRRAALIVTLRDTKEQTCRPVNCLDQVWVTKDYGLSAWKEFADALPTAASLDTVGGASVVIVSKNGEAVGPFTIGKIVSDREGQTTYLTDGGSELVVDSGESTKFRMLQDRIYVPAGSHVIRCQQYGDNADMLLGEPGEIDREAFAGFAKMSVARAGNFITVASPLDRRSVRLGKEAMQLLMHGHGLSEGHARKLLADAGDNLNPVTVRVKYADNAYLATNQRIGPIDDLPNDFGEYDMRSGESVPEQERQFVNSPVDIPPQYQRPADQVHYVSPSHESAFQIAQQAGEDGRQQAFDAGVLTSMLRNMRDDQLIDRFIPALSRAMDASGRLLYQFYWHQDDFAARYGDQDMPELGDSLRNIFEGLGDMVLKLKQKTVDPYPEEQDLGVNLTDLAGA